MNKGKQIQTINFKLAEIALSNVTGEVFEKFFHAFYSSIAGSQFIPLGGIHDGGADAFFEESIFEVENRKPTKFFQASIQEDFRSKIRKTVRRLKEVGRQPTVLEYFTSRTINKIDMEMENLSNELEVYIFIRDNKWIIANINNSQQTVEAFNSYLRPNVNFLEEIGGNSLLSSAPENCARTMCVFLGQEIDRRRGNTDLLRSVTDSLILWALEGTNPDNDNFMTREKVLKKIMNALPSAKHFIHKQFDQRIEGLASKGNASGREVRWHRKEDKFCLPYATRLEVEKENTQDEHLKLKVIQVYEQRAKNFQNNEGIQPELVAEIVHRALELTFENNGLVLSNFLTGDDQDDQTLTISDQVDYAISEANLSQELAARVRHMSQSILRDAFYNSVEEERVYYGKLSRTYTLLFTLRNVPQIVDYFQEMSSNFILFIGADIIIRALSERYLAEKDQMTVNMLRILSGAGSTLILTQTTVEEVQHHIKVTNYEFQNNFAVIEQDLDKEFTKHADKILLRAYFHAKFDPHVENPPKGWRNFVEQICNFNDIQNASKSVRQVMQYLVTKFKFEYLDTDELDELTKRNEVEQLASDLIEIKSSDVLAENDARQVLAVYGKRKKLKEEHRPNPYGYRVWWLTHETRIRQKTKKIEKQKGAKYIMRPEFILNFIALSPKTAEVRESYEKIFPTLLGVKLANRMREDIFHKVINQAKELRDYDEARIKVMMSEMSNRLKGDNIKEYEIELSQQYFGELE